MKHYDVAIDGPSGAGKSTVGTGGGGGRWASCMWTPGAIYRTIGVLHVPARHPAHGRGGR